MVFSDFEIEIIKANGGLISFVPEPNGDQSLDSFALYARFACANGVSSVELAYHLGLYLLYMAVMDADIVSQNTYV